MQAFPSVDGNADTLLLLTLGLGSSGLTCLSNLARAHGFKATTGCYLVKLAQQARTPPFDAGFDGQRFAGAR